MDDEIDAIFAEMTEDLDLEMPEPTHDLDFGRRIPDMTKFQLLNERHRVTKILNEHDALIHPRTEEDKDLQGYYFGLTQEMRQRGML